MRRASPYTVCLDKHTKSNVMMLDKHTMSKSPKQEHVVKRF